MPAITPANIHIAPADLWTGGTPPAAGTDPLDPTAGTPSVFNTATTSFAAVTSGGTYIGATQGASTITYRPTFYMVEVEQAMGEVVTIPTAEEASATFTLVEVGYANLATAFGQGTTRVQGGTVAQGIYVGSKSVVSTKVTALVSRKRSGTGYYIGTLYSSYSMEGGTFTAERRQEARIAVTMRCLADTARPIGDQLFQLVAFDANPA
jgi:hypothetical protein